MSNSVSLSGYPQDYGWIPHERDTWEYEYAKVRDLAVVTKFTGRWDNNRITMISPDLDAGTVVRIVDFQKVLK